MAAVSNNSNQDEADGLGTNYAGFSRTNVYCKHLQKPEFKRIGLWRIAFRYGTSCADCACQIDIGTPHTTPYNPTKLHDMPITHQRPDAADATAILYGGGFGR